MKRFITISLLLTLFACKSSLQIVSTKKQNIIPGVQSAKPYTKYLIEFNVDSKQTFIIDSVLAYEKDKACKVATHFIKDQKMNNVITQVTTPGTYLLNATVKENSLKRSVSSSSMADKLSIYYSENGKSKIIEVNSFAEETVRRR